MAYTAVELRRPIRIDRIITVHYFEYGPDYAFAGESHDFWEIVYVDKGEIIAQAGDVEHLLQKGQMLFHEPGEFHTLKAAGGRAPRGVRFFSSALFSGCSAGRVADGVRNRRCAAVRSREPHAPRSISSSRAA